MSLPALLLLAAQGAPPPIGVNGAVLGTAEEFRVTGPARVCLMQTSVDLRSDESAYLDYLGIHFGIIRIVGRRGSFLVRVGSWREPPGGRLEEDSRGRTIARYLRQGRPRYLIYAASENAAHGESPSTWVEGDALGRSNDRAILSRVLIHPDVPSGCRRRFIYGWDTIVEPPEEQR